MVDPPRSRRGAAPSPTSREPWARSCDACGGHELWEHLRHKLQVRRGGTTDDGRFTLRAAECLASCGTAPVLLLDGERHENLTLAQVDKLLESAR